MLVRVKDDVAQRYGLFLGRGAEEVDEPGADDAVVNHVVAAAGVAERRRDQYLQDHLVLPMGFGQVGRDPALLTGPCVVPAGRRASQEMPNHEICRAIWPRPGSFGESRMMWTNQNR